MALLPVLLLLLAPPTCPAAALPAAAALVAFYPLTNYVGSFGGNIVHPPDAPEPPRAAGAASYMVGPTGCEETCYEPDPTIYIANHLRESGSAGNEDRLLLKHGRSTVFFYLKLRRHGQVLTFRDNKNVTWPSSGDGLSLELSTSSRLQLKPGKDGAALVSVSGLTLSRWYHVGLLIDMWDHTVTLQVDDISSSGPLPASSVQKDYVVLGSGEAGTVCVMGLAVYEAELKADDISALREVTLNEFACVDPLCGCLLSMSPNYGPIAGGTRVTMHGRNFHFLQRPHLVLPPERFPGIVEAVVW